MQKRITVGIAGSDGREYKGVAILPGTRAADLLKQLQLHGFQLQKPDGGFFDSRDDLYEAVSPEQKLLAARADVEAGR